MVRRMLVLAALAAAPLGAQAGKADFDAGLRLMREGKAAEAEARFERAIAQDGRVALYHLWLGNAVGQQAQAASTVRQPFMARRIKAEFERAVALDPDLLDAREGLIGFYMQAPGFMGGSPEKAREQQREIAKRNPYRGHLAASTLAAFAKDTAGVERALRAAIATAPDSTRAVVTLAQRQQSWGRPAEAFRTLDQALARRPGDIALRFQLGRLAATSGEQLRRAGPAHPPGGTGVGTFEPPAEPRRRALPPGRHPRAEGRQGAGPRQLRARGRPRSAAQGRQGRARGAAVRRAGRGRGRTAAHPHASVSRHGDSRSSLHPPGCGTYRSRSCSRLGRPCQNSKLSGTTR